MTRTYTCPITHTAYALPKGLTTHQNKLRNRWRYSNAAINNGKQECLSKFIETNTKEFPPEEAIRIAEAINAKFSDGVMPSSTLSIAVQDFAALRLQIAESEGRAGEKSFVDDTYWLNKFARELGRISTSELSNAILQDWWYARNDFSTPEYRKSGHTQRAMRPVLREFVGHMKRNGTLLNIDNVFNPASESYIKPLGKVKIRKHITLKQFEQVKEIAIKQGKQWLANAMDVSLLTGLRRGDICRLTFDGNLSNGVLKTIIGKSHSQNQIDPASLYWTLSEHPELANVIARCEATRNQCLRKTKGNSETRPAIHIIHDPYTRIKTTKDKIHSSQITESHLSHTFRDIANLVPSIAAMPSEERPTFHEIRALHINVQVEDGEGLETARKSVGHRSDNTTRKYNSGHSIVFKEAKGITGEDISKHKERLSEGRDIAPAAVKDAGNVISFPVRKQK